MGAGFTSYSVDNDRVFRDALEIAREKVGDLTIPLSLIRADFYKSEKAIFQLKGPGQYPDLAPATKVEKRLAGFSVYPILKRTGALERSVTSRDSPYSVGDIVNGDTLFIGSTIPYGLDHQNGNSAKRIPMRKFLFIGPESTEFASDERFSGRLERWENILAAYVMKASEGIGRAA